VEAILLVNGMLTVPPLQIVAEEALVIVGAGLMVTVTVKLLPVQPAPDVGVTV
jgi:hypothetical protein